MAGILSGELDDVEFHDITSHDLGILNHEEQFEILISAGSVFPMEITRLFTTAYDNQEEVTIQVVQDRGENSSKNLIPLGSFNLCVDKAQKKGDPNIDVTFTIDMNSILTVSAIDLDTQKNAKISINYEFVKPVK